MSGERSLGRQVDCWLFVAVSGGYDTGDAAAPHTRHRRRRGCAASIGEAAERLLPPQQAAPAAVAPGAGSAREQDGGLLILGCASVHKPEVSATVRPGGPVRSGDPQKVVCSQSRSRLVNRQRTVLPAPPPRQSGMPPLRDFGKLWGPVKRPCCRTGPPGTGRAARRRGGPWGLGPKPPHWQPRSPPGREGTARFLAVCGSGRQEPLAGGRKGPFVFAL